MDQAGWLVGWHLDNGARINIGLVLTASEAVLEAVETVGTGCFVAKAPISGSEQLYVSYIGFQRRERGREKGSRSENALQVSSGKFRRGVAPNERKLLIFLLFLSLCCCCCFLNSPVFIERELCCKFLGEFRESTKSKGCTRYTYM